MSGSDERAVLAAWEALARRHSLPACGRLGAKGWPTNTFAFASDSLAIDSAYLKVGFDERSPQFWVAVTYNGTNDPYFERLCDDVKQTLTREFGGRVVSTNSIHWPR